MNNDFPAKLIGTYRGRWCGCGRMAATITFNAKDVVYQRCSLCLFEIEQYSGALLQTLNAAELAAPVKKRILEN
jgi:hypothetical protein